MDEIVYHYTSQDAFLNIMREKTLRFSNVHYMNDAQEFSHILSLIKVALEEQLGSGGNNEALFQAVVNQVSKLHRDIYACCFSCNMNDLNQWRAYGNSSPGYSIGFFKKKLEEAAKCKTGEVIYDDDHNVKNYIEERLATYRNKIVNPQSNQMSPSLVEMHARDSLIDSIFEWAAENAPFYKNSAFKHENEYRLIMYSHGNVEFNSGQSYIRPYKMINFGEKFKEVIAEVWVGPGPNPELAERSTLMFLQKNSLEKVKVESSKLPYRYW